MCVCGMRSLTERKRARVGSRPIADLLGRTGVQMAYGDFTRHNLLCPRAEIWPSLSLSKLSGWVAKHTLKILVVLTRGCHSSPVSSQEALRQMPPPTRLLLLLLLHQLFDRGYEQMGWSEKRQVQPSRLTDLQPAHRVLSRAVPQASTWDLSSKQLCLSSKWEDILRNQIQLKYLKMLIPNAGYNCEKQ